MGTPLGVNTSPLPDSPKAALRDRERVEGYVALICFKHGPPRLHGVELEWTVHHRSDPSRPLTARQLSFALGQHAPRTINPHSPQVPLPGGSLVTVEPGGQVEISPPPFTSAAALIAAASTDSANLESLLDSCGLVLGRHGTDPHRPPSLLLQVPRYGAMRDAFDAVGPDGLQMMCSTASVQVCLDAGEAGQVAARWRAVHTVGPALVALFANSPDMGGRPTGWASSRVRATLGTWPPFTSPPAPSDDPAAQWARTVLEAPVICVRGDGASWTAPRGLTFARWMADPHVVGRPPTRDDLDYHLTTIFPPVRPKGYLEIRYLDSQPGSAWAAPFALLSALVARPSTIDQVLDLTESTAHLWLEAAHDGLSDRRLREAARRIVELGIDSLDDLDLSAAQRSCVVADLTLRVETVPLSRRRTA